MLSHSSLIVVRPFVLCMWLYITLYVLTHCTTHSSLTHSSIYITHSSTQARAHASNISDLSAERSPAPADMKPERFLPFRDPAPFILATSEASVVSMRSTLAVSAFSASAFSLARPSVFASGGLCSFSIWPRGGGRVMRVWNYGGVRVCARVCVCALEKWRLRPIHVTERYLPLPTRMRA